MIPGSQRLMGPADVALDGIGCRTSGAEQLPQTLAGFFDHTRQIGIVRAPKRGFIIAGGDRFFGAYRGHEIAHGVGGE